MTPTKTLFRTSWCTRAALACLPLLLSACAVPTLQPSDLPTVHVPAQWGVATPSASPQSLAQWWQRFDDPVLSRLIGEALASNTDVRSARATLRQSRALRDGKAAGLRPSVSAAASAQASQAGGADAVNTFQLGFDASWEPDIFGNQRSALAAAEADALAAQSSLGQVQVSLAAEVAVTYLDLRGLQARLAIARRNLAAQEETLQITRWRVQAGLASSLDAEQAVAASEQTAAQIPVLASSLAQDRSSLAVLTGQVPGALDDVLKAQGDGAAAMPMPPTQLAVSIPAQTLRQRPDVRAAEYRVQAALARLSQADAARYPSFQLSGALGLRSLALATLTDGASVVRTLLAGISVPLLDGGAARAQVEAQDAALEQARVAYEAVVLTALKEVEDALVAMQNDRERLQRLQAAATAAANAELLARQRYASGLIDFRTVLDTQRTLLSTQDAVQTTQTSLGADHVRLYKALGGGWTPDADAPNSAP